MFWKWFWKALAILLVLVIFVGLGVSIYRAGYTHGVTAGALTGEEGSTLVHPRGFLNPGYIRPYARPLFFFPFFGMFLGLFLLMGIFGRFSHIGCFCHDTPEPGIRHGVDRQ